MFDNDAKYVPEGIVCRALSQRPIPCCGRTASGQQPQLAGLPEPCMKAFVDLLIEFKESSFVGFAVMGGSYL